MSRSFRQSFLSDLKHCCCQYFLRGNSRESSQRDHRQGASRGYNGARSFSVMPTRGDSTQGYGRKTTVNSFKGRTGDRPFQTVT